MICFWWGKYLCPLNKVKYFREKCMLINLKTSEQYLFPSGKNFQSRENAAQQFTSGEIAQISVDNSENFQWCWPIFCYLKRIRIRISSFSVSNSGGNDDSNNEDPSPRLVIDEPDPDAQVGSRSGFRSKSDPDTEIGFESVSESEPVPDAENLFLTKTGSRCCSRSKICVLIQTVTW